MSQSFEYPMFSPNKKAKLYKRLTNDIPVGVGDDKVITVQSNRYVFAGLFRWIETSSKQDVDEQPIEGLIIPNSYITIKTNSLKNFEDGDIVELPKCSPLAGYWIIVDGKETKYVYTPVQVQTFQLLPLSSVGVS